MTPQEPPRPILPYQPPEPTPAIPIAVQALIAAVVTLGVSLAGVTFIIVIFGDSGPESGGATLGVLFAVFAVAILITTVMRAREMKRDPMRRGWAIGIYIGLGLAGLFWGACGVLIFGLSM